MTRILFASILAGALALLACLTPSEAQATVPVRISVKFILDMNGNRPATGDVNTTADVQDQIDRSNQILADLGSELRVDLVEIVDVGGAGQFFASDIGGESRDDIRDAALDAPGAFAWRTNAVNVYVNGDTGSAVADFPGDNNIVLVGQSIFDTTFLHELGHILDLFHTHETVGSDGADECGDTLFDMSNWAWQDIADSEFGVGSTLNSAETAQVDAVWNNVMSYHDGDNRSFLTGCQMNRNSDQSWEDRDWILTRLPLYVDPNTGAGGNSGSWGDPFASVDEAIGWGSLSDRVLVLLSGTHSMSLDLTATDLDVVSRRGTATIRNDISPWEGRVDPSQSQVAAVAEAMRAVQEADRAGDADRALDALRQGERHATGEERIAIRLELGQRLRHAGQHEAAIHQYEQVAEETDDETLRDHAQYWIGRVQESQKSSEKSEGGAPGSSHQPDENARGLAATGTQGPGAPPSAPGAPHSDTARGAGPRPAGISETVSHSSTGDSGQVVDASREVRPESASPAVVGEAGEHGVSMAPCDLRSSPQTARDKAVLAGAFLLGATFLGTAFARQRSRRS